MSCGLVKIELSQPYDASTLGELYLASRAVALPSVRVIHGSDEVEAWIRNSLLPAGTTWVARRGGMICGFMTLKDKVIEQLYLWPDRRREGIGRALLEHAKALSPHRLTLVCFAANAGARKFYEKHGFVVISSRDGSMNEEGAPDVVYEWKPDWEADNETLPSENKTKSA